MQNLAVWLCYGLRKYDHVTGFYHRLRWLPLPCLHYYVQCTTSSINLNVFHPLDPLICFGGSSFILFIKALQHKCWRSVGHQVLHPAKEIEFSSSYCTRRPTFFANILMFRLHFFFCYKTIQWWNALPSSVTNCINSTFYEYVDSLWQYCDSLLISIAGYLIMYVLL